MISTWRLTLLGHWMTGRWFRTFFIFTLSLWGLHVQGKIVFADKAQFYAWCCILILAKLPRDLELLGVGSFFYLLPTVSASTNDRHEVNENLLAQTELKHGMVLTATELRKKIGRFAGTRWNIQIWLIFFNGVLCTNQMIDGYAWNEI